VRVQHRSHSLSRARAASCRAADARFAHSNPLHADIFPACARMEREVVAMTASLLGGGRGGRASVCGCLTSGGTESILTAIRATRDFFAAERVRACALCAFAQLAH
jgi:glutamate/tyrosine decarboxylase-like PLP-dependent enzyme